jgi:hypothetical protein
MRMDFLMNQTLTYRTKPYYNGTSKKNSVCQKFDSVRVKVDARMCLYM